MADTAIARQLRQTTYNTSLPISALALAALALAPLPVAVLGGIALATSIGVRPWTAIPIVVLTLPYYLHPRTLGGVEVSLTEAAILLGVAGVLGRAVAERAFTPTPTLPAQGVRETTPLPDPLPQGGRGLGPPHPGILEDGEGGPVHFPQASPADWAAAVMLAAALLSLLITEYPKQSMRELRWLIVEPLMLFYVARATIATTLQARVVLWSIVASGAIAVLVAFASLAARGELATPLARATDPYLSPNHLGLFLGRAGAVALALALFSPALTGRARSNERLLSWVGFVAIGAGVLRTVSLGAWAGLAALLLALTALRGRRWLAVTTVGIVVLFLAAVAVLPGDRTTGRLNPSTGTALFRLQIWTSSLHMIVDHPLLGVGLDNFLYQYRDGYMLPEAAEEPNISHPHNWLLHFWLELGLLGIAAVVGLLVWVGKTAWRLARSPSQPEDRLVGAAATAVFVDTLVHGSLDNSYFLVDAAVLWWLLIALLAIHSHASNGATGPSEPVT